MVSFCRPVWLDKPLRHHRVCASCKMVGLLIPHTHWTFFLWKHIKQIKGGVEDSCLPDELEVDNETSYTPIDILNKLNGYFANISERLKASSSNNSQPKNDFLKLKSKVFAAGVAYF